MTDFPLYPTAPEDVGDPAHHRRLIARAANGAVEGKMNNLGEVTLTNGAASTTLTDSRLTFYSTLLFEPTTANAAAEQGNGTMYVSAKTNGSCTITHANNAQTDRTFRYAIFG